MLFYFVETENHPEDLQVLRYSSAAGSPLALHSVSPPRHDRQVALRGRCRTEPAVCAPGWGGRAVEALLPLCLCGLKVPAQTFLSLRLRVFS